MRRAFPKGHKKFGGRKPGVKNKQTLWVLESLKAHGVDYEKMLAQAMLAAQAGDKHAMEFLDRLAKLAPHIANKPKEVIGMEGIEGLVIQPYEEKKPESK